LRGLRRVLIERSGSAERLTDLSFNDMLRAAADAGLLADPAVWRTWREMRNATRHAYDEIKAQEVAVGAERFHTDALALLAAMERVT
jgi:Nucleotidyltransferase substrate binding protein like